MAAQSIVRLEDVHPMLNSPLLVAVKVITINDITKTFNYLNDI